MKNFVNNIKLRQYDRGFDMIKSSFPPSLYKTFRRTAMNLRLGLGSVS